MAYNLTSECREILEAATAAGGNINIVEASGAEWVTAGSQSFIGEGEPDPQTMRRYRDALYFLVRTGFVDHRGKNWYELTTRGWQGDLSELDIADVSGDYLEMAQHLADKGHHIPAASVAGAVLEDFLRKLHIARIGPWKGESKLSRLNTNLYKAGVYGNPVQQQVTAWAALRNPADHGHFHQVDSAQVKLMIRGIRDFIAKYEG